MTRATNIMAIILASILLTGCFEATKRAGGVEPACTALVGPIRYNSKVRTSRRFAGPDLVTDLSKRNRVGLNLGCPAYRR